MGGSEGPRNVAIQDVRVQVHVSPTSTKVVVPLVVGHFNNPQEQQVNNSTPLVTEIIVNEPTAD